MTDFQILIAQGQSAEEQDNITDTAGRFDTEQHSGGKKAIEKIDELAGIWDTVVEKLTAIATSTKEKVEDSPYELDTIEFNIGIEAGLNIGLVTKGKASVSVAFKKKA